MPTTPIIKFPVGVDAVVWIVRVDAPPPFTEGGANVHVVFAGHPVVLNVTVSLNPPEGVTVTANVVELGLTTRFLGGVALIVKSPTPESQDANLTEPMRVLQLKDPFACKYSLVYQKVQSSAGSIDNVL